MFTELTEWEKERIGKFTSSKASVLHENAKSKEQVFSVAGYKYIYEKAAEILTKQPSTSERFSAPATEWGNANELEGLELFKKQVGLKDNEVEFYGGNNPLFYHYTDFSGGSPDGKTSTHVLELKCPYNTGNHIVYLALKDTAHFKKECKDYYWQMVMNMMCLKVKKGYFISYDPRILMDNLKLKVLEIVPPEEDFKMMEKRIQMAEEELSKIVLGIVG